MTQDGMNMSLLPIPYNLHSGSDGWESNLTASGIAWSRATAEEYPFCFHGNAEPNKLQDKEGEMQLGKSTTPHE